MNKQELVHKLKYMEQEKNTSIQSRPDVQMPARAKAATAANCRFQGNEFGSTCYLPVPLPVWMAGWTVHSVHLRSLYSAVLDRNLRSFVAQIAASCSRHAVDHVSFRSPRQQMQQQEQQAEHCGAASKDAGSSVGSLLGIDNLEKLPSLQVSIRRVVIVKLSFRDWNWRCACVFL